MEIVKDLKGREVAKKIGTIDESKVKYTVARKWAGRWTETVPLTLEEANDRYAMFASMRNHGLEMRETIELGMIK